MIPQNIDEWFACLRTVALDGLQQMFIPKEGLFCQRIWHDGKELRVDGVSLRYSAMVIIGYCAGGKRQKNPVGWSVDEVCSKLVYWARDTAGLGDLGLILWALLLAEHDGAFDVLNIISQREARLKKKSDELSSMGLGFLLAGLSTAVLKGCRVDTCFRLADLTTNILLKRQGKKSGLFSLSGYSSRRKFLTRWMRKQLGSFASQVYPMIGLSIFHTACGRQDALSSAVRALDAICHLQGADGQWWWIYHIKRGVVVIRYPVYSVHQDAMGPMALLAVERAGGPKRYKHLCRSFNWFVHRTELPDKEIIDSNKKIIWRAIQCDAPADTGTFGLGVADRRRMLWASLTGKRDKRTIQEGWVCYECRPYHLGWILLADAWFSEMGGGNEIQTFSMADHPFICTDCSSRRIEDAWTLQAFITYGLEGICSLYKAHTEYKL